MPADCIAMNAAIRGAASGPLANGVRVHAIAATASLMALFSPAAWAIPTVISSGARVPVCQEASRLAGTLSEGDFYSGSNWREKFASTEWQLAKYRQVGSDGVEHEIPYSWAVADIFNDGHPEIVIRETESFAQREMDWIHIAGAAEHSAAMKAGTERALLSAAPAVNPSNVVLFGNKGESVPVEMEVWSHRTRQYLVLREVEFPGGTTKYANSLIVAELRDRMAKTEPGKTNPRLIATLVCRLRGK
jgi:hypothetical protein